jgi:hypothetical protein
LGAPVNRCRVQHEGQERTKDAQPHHDPTESFAVFSLRVLRALRAFVSKGR